MKRLLRSAKPIIKHKLDLSNRRTQMLVIFAGFLWTIFTMIIYLMIMHNNQYKWSFNMVKTIKNEHISDSLSYIPSKAVKQKFDMQRSQSMPKTLQNVGVLMIACNRTLLLQESLLQLIRIRAETQLHFNVTFNIVPPLPIVVSLDCDDWLTKRLLKKISQAEPETIHQIFYFPLANKPVLGLNKSQRRFEGYYRIARHYGWAIDQTLTHNPAIQQLIIVEEDLNFSPDFFEYFLALSPLLESDPTLICISAWNDNGKNELIDQQAKSRLYRTDFFPGLGWMIKRSVWENELKSKWPQAFWDDWLRHWERMRGRTCIRPEISRASTTGKIGVSKGQFFDKHLKYIHHFTDNVHFFEQRDRLYVELRDASYEQTFRFQVYNQSEPIHPIALKHLKPSERGYSEGKNQYRLTYYNRHEFESIAQMFGLMNDFKNGVPRTAYLGVVSFIYRGHRAFLAPPISRKMYIKQWV